MQATPRLCLGLPVRLLVGGPRMPKTARPAAASLSPSRGSYRGRRDVGVHRPIAPGRSSLPVPRESFHPSVPTLRNLASHPLRRLRSCPSQRGDNAGSIARHTVSKWRSRRARNVFVLTEYNALTSTKAGGLTGVFRSSGTVGVSRDVVSLRCPERCCLTEWVDDDGLVRLPK